MSIKKFTGRVDPSQITQFLCFTCGDTFNSNVDYHRHLMEHQAVSLIYQLYYLEQQHQNSKGDSKKESITSPPAVMTPRRNTDPGRKPVFDVSKRSYSEDVDPKEEARKKLQRQRQAVAQEAVKTAEKSVRRASFKDTPSPIKKPKLSRPDGSQLLKFSESNGYLTMTSHEMFCHICPENPYFKYPLQALSHWVNHHKATISRTELQFFADMNLQQSIANSPGTSCPVCEMEFNPTIGYLHALEYHLADLVETLIKVKKVEQVDELIINVSATLPSQPEAVIRICATVVKK